MTVKEANEHLRRTVRNKKTSIKYLLTGITKRWSNQGVFFQAELKDLKANDSVCVCRVDDLEETK